MTLTASRTTAILTSDLRDRGLELNETERGSTVARGPTELVDVDAPLEVIPLPDASPLSIVSVVANAAHDGNVPVLLTDEHTRAAAESVLADPFLLSGTDGGRRFRAVEDRIRLTNDRYACVASYGPMRWSEADDETTDSPSLTLDVGGDPAAVLDSVDRLACPGPSPTAFRCSYARGDDGRFRVFENDRRVARYTSITAMREGGFRPVPLPLVPEHHVRVNGALARATRLAVVSGVADDPTVEYFGP